MQSPFLLTRTMSNSGASHRVAVAARTGALPPHVQQRAVSSLICAATVARHKRGAATNGAQPRLVSVFVHSMANACMHGARDLFIRTARRYGRRTLCVMSVFDRENALPHTSHLYFFTGTIPLASRAKRAARRDDSARKSSVI